MSDTPCNFCKYQAILHDASLKGQIVTTKKNTPDDLKEFMEGEPGIDVFVDGRLDLLVHGTLKQMCMLR